MALINQTVPTLLDITTRANPDGKPAVIAEILNKDLALVQDMPWKEGNLVTGERTTVRNGLPSVGFRRLNEGVARSKSSVRQFDETAALLEANSVVDRDLAILSGDVAAFRLSEDKPFIESMGQTFEQTMFYGNEATASKEFTGLTPRFNSLSGPFANQIIDAGGTGSNNSSIWIIGWDTDKVYGIYPKGTVGGLKMMDTTTNRNDGGDGHWTGDYVYDAAGNPYLAYSAHYAWKMGLAVKDPRYVVRICNISKSLLTKDLSTGADLQDLILLGLSRMKSLTAQTRIYTSRNIETWALRQSTYERRAFFDRRDVNGVPTATFNQIPIRRTDALINDEARVV